MALIKPKQKVVYYHAVMGPGSAAEKIQKDIEDHKDWYIQSITPIHGYSGVIVLWENIGQ